MKTFMQKEVIGVIIAALIVGGGAGYYAAGMMGGSSGADRAAWGNREGGPRGAGMMGGARGARGGAGFAAGEVIAKDETGITVKSPDGSTKIIFVTESTEVMNAEKGTVSDVVVGKNVMVNGTPNQDGSVTAQSVNIRPAGMAFPTRGAPRAEEAAQ